MPKAPTSLATSCLATLLAFGAAAGSDLAVPRPEPLGRFEATIFDLGGTAIGTTEVESRLEAGGRIRVSSESRVDGAVVNAVETLMTPIGDGSTLRPLWQRARSSDGSGGLAEIHVDHERARATCTPPGAPPLEVPLAAPDRIANAPMLLLLRPLSAREADRVRFQMLVCPGWPRPSLLEVEARRSDATPDGAVEIHYRFGGFLGWLAGLLVDVRIWTRPEPPYAWVGNRFPLRPFGDDVVMVRDGVDPTPFLVRAR